MSRGWETRMTDERVIFRGSPSQWENFGVFLVAGLLGGLVFPLFWAAWRWLETRCTRYEVTSERISYEYGVLSKRVEEVELYRVKDTAFDQPFWLRLVGLGHVVLRSSDRSDPVLVLRALRDGRALRENLRGAIEKIREKKGVRELDV
jgi:uncharacterized membrane protein YdbT with pleckstrin-like domain